jgi:hypothetical protein
LQSNVNFGSFQTQEELVRAYADIAARIQRGNDVAIYDLPRPIAGGALNQSDLNTFFLGVYSEIIYLLTATKGSGSLVESNFNFAAAAIRELQAGVKRINHELAVYSLYSSGFGSSRYHGETFSTEENIDRGSSFLIKKECSISLADGTASLPRKATTDQWKVQKIEIGSLSNGVLGNNTEAGAPIRGTISSMYDGNVDTWTEYEKVVNAEDEETLRLELKISLDDIRVVNGIKLHPIFLGARTPPVIDVIKVSEDGRVWTSLKDEVSVAEFMGERLEDRFHLSPGSSRFAGEFNIVFAPRFTKFISILIRQSSSFPITDVYGSRKLRYAIGIKEIAVYGFQYETAGELISKPIQFTDDFTAASIISLVDPPFVPRTVGGAEYYLSFNDGASWDQLTSQEDADSQLPEVLSPEAATKALRWKVRLFKDEAAFEKSIPRPSISTREIYNYPDRSPKSIKLEHKPKDGTVSVCDPNIGSRGKLYPKMVLGKGVFSELKVDPGGGGNWERHGNTELKLQIPISEIDNPDEVYVYVNNVQFAKGIDWSGADRFTRRCIVRRSTDASTDGTDSSLEVVFGNGDGLAPVGMIPAATDTISVCLSQEYVSLDGIAAPYKLKLAYSSNGNKKDTQIKFAGQPFMIAANETLPTGITKYKLVNSDRVRLDETSSPPKRLVIRGSDSGPSWVAALGSTASYIGAPAIPSSTTFIRYREFIDGSTELDASGDWTLDPVRGYLYMKTPVDDYTYSISYYPDSSIYLEETDWDFVSGKLDEIDVYETGYHTISGSQSLSSGVKSADLTGSTGIVPKSVRINGDVFGAGISPFEVPYINGADEFEVMGKIQDEIIPQAVSAGVPAIAKFQITHHENLIPTSGFSFTNQTGPSPTFTNMVINYASLANVGDYYIDVDGSGVDGLGYVYVVLTTAGSTIPANETIAYYYRDAYSSERMKGSYSVDQVNGRVFFSEALSATGTAKFKYTSYTVSYNISREFESGSEWKLKEDGQTIVLDLSSNSSQSGKVSVRYEYEVESLNVADLAPYYSPLLRALAVKVA